MNKQCDKIDRKFFKCYNKFKKLVQVRFTKVYNFHFVDLSFQRAVEYFYWLLENVEEGEKENEKN